MFKKLILSLFLMFLLCNSLHAIEPWSGLTDTSCYHTGKKYLLPTGHYFEAVIKTAVFSFNIEPPVVAEVEFDQVYLNKTMIPKGSKIIGYASLYHSDNRINIVFHTIVFPDGSEIKFSGMALYTDGSAGIPGKIKNVAQKIPLIAMFSALGSIAFPGTAGNIAGAVSEQARQSIEKYTPSDLITVPQDTPILIYNIQRIEY